MNYRDWIKDKNSIFTEMALNDPSGVISLIGADNLSILYESMFGDRNVPKTLVRFPIDQVAGLVETLYLAKWEWIYISDLDSLGSGVESERVIEESFLDVNTKNVASDNVDQTTAFNDPTFIDDHSNNNTINETDNKDRLRVFTETVKSNATFDKQRKIMENRNIGMTICKDVSKVLGLSVY